MSYRIEKNELLSDAFGRIAAEEIAQALAQLQHPNRPEAMHNTRKSLKRLRALLRSLRVALPRDLFHRENRRLAEAGRKIAPLRDIHVQLRALGKLRKNGGSAAKETRQSLRLRQDYYLRKMPALHRAVRQMLSASWQNLTSWPMQKATPERLAAGLKRIYKRSRAAWKTARKQETAENLHEWRKQAKMLWYGLALIERLAPKKAATMIRHTENICDALGDDHDLYLVLQALRQEDAAHPARDYKRLAKRIAAKRAGLQKQAFQLGKETFEVKPGAFAHRVEDWIGRHNSTR